MARQPGARTQTAAAFESVYGIAPVSGFTRLPFASTTLGSAQPLLESELLGYGRDPLAPVKDAVTVDGDMVVPICARSFGFWLKGAFGQPSTTAVAAAGLIEFTVNPTDGDTITLNGTVWTFVDATAAGPQTEIQGTLIQTLDALVAALNLSADEEIEKATYSRPANTERLIIAFDTAGASGNGFTLAASAAAVSGARLTGGGYTHVYQSGGWTLPSISIEKQLPQVPRFEMFSGCVVDQISWQMQRAGLLTSSVRLIAQSETSSAATQAGSLSDLVLQRFGSFQGSIARNGAALGNVVSTEITYGNNIDRIETIRNDGMIDGADPSMAMLQGRTEMRFADTTLLAQAQNGEPCEMSFAYALPGGESLTFVAHAVYLPRPRVEISGPQGVQVSYDWQAALDPIVGRMCTVTLFNDVATY